jgi:hypothetical protein
MIVISVIIIMMLSHSAPDEARLRMIVISVIIIIMLSHSAPDEVSLVSSRLV